MTLRPQPREREPRAPVPRGSVQIGRFLGVPLYLSASWLLILAFVTVAFADIFRRSVDGATGATPYLLAAAYAVLSALCVLLHELGHVVVALSLGLRVRRVFVHLLGGVSEIDPEPQHARQEILVSAAGPLASGVVAGLTGIGAWLSPHGSAIGVELEILAWSNLFIAVFNALPGLPLDGGRVLRAAVWGVSKSRVRGTVAAAWGGRVVAVAVAASGLLVTDHQWQVVSVVFSAALGAFLWFAAGQSIAAARITDRLPGVRVADLLRPAVYLPADTPVAEALRRLWAQGARAIVVVDSAGRPRAIVTEALVNRLGESERVWTPISDVAAQIDHLPTVRHDLRGSDVLAVVTAQPAADYLVEADGRVVGVLSTNDLRGALMLPEPTFTPRAGE